MSGATKISGELQAGTSGTTDSSAMETEEYYNPEGGEWSQKVDTGQLCRVCANPNEYLIPIFDGEGLEHELSVKIEKHLPIKVTETDALPQQMCYQCASTLIAWHDLVLNCVEADKKLRELQADEDDDDDDKGAEMFESHSMDSDPADEVDQPSTSESQITAKLQVPKKTVLSKDKKPKLKMVLVKGSLAGTSGQKTVAKTQVAKALELAKSKEGGNEDSASERFQQSSLSTFNTVQREEIDGDNLEEKKNIINSSQEINDNSFWIKVENENCYFCGVAFASKDELDNHVTKLHHNNDNKCLKCDGSFKQESSFVSEIDIHENRILDGCSNSSDHGADPNDETYFIKVSNVKTARLFNKKPTKKMRNESTSQDNFFTCEDCGKKFKKLYLLNKHIKSHDIFKTEEVSELQVVTDDEQEDRSDEEALIKDKSKKTYKCDLCNKQFTVKDSFKSHLRTHTGEKPFTCHICGKQFSHTGGLYYHLKHVHAGIKNQSCDICGRSFALRAAMEDHRRIHTGERPFVCHTCGKSFKSKASLYIHSKIHTDSFPHSCTYCERRFRWRQQLLAHITTHTGEKPHKCEICGKGFGVKNDLTRHKLIHSDDKPYTCTVCGLSFAQKRYLKNHEKARHVTQR